MAGLVMVGEMVDQEVGEDVDVVLTPVVAPAIALEYFSVEPYSSRDTGKNDRGGKPVFVKVPNDPPTWDGFCARYGVPMSRLDDLIPAEVREICESKYKHFMMVNGLVGGYAASPWALTMKNTAGWAEKSEVKHTDMSHEEALREMIRQEMAGSVIDVTPVTTESQSAAESL